MDLAAKSTGLRLRARMVQAIRAFFMERGYLEVETPHLVPAPAPEIHIDAVPARGGYLQTSPELCMKRLLAAGYAKIFQIGRCFRLGERGRRHLPEFTMLEWYRTKTDYRGLMEECESLILAISEALGTGEKIRYQGKEVELKKPFQRLSLREAFRRHAPVSLDEALKGDAFEEILVGHIEAHLGHPRPTFLYDYPAAQAALARTKPGAPELAERFELYMAGLEIANAFSELNDAREQRRRFEEALEIRRASTGAVYPMPERFLEALPQMPEAAGIALGIDRLAMVFADAPRIDDIVAFTPEEL